MSERENFDELELEAEAAAAATQEAPATSAETKSKPAKKDGKPAKKNEKPGLFARIARYFREMRSELRKVAWPTRKQTVNNTLIVIACVLIVGVFIWAFDWLARLLIDALIQLSGRS